MSTTYREATFDSYQTWKLDILCNIYTNGGIGFKQLCSLANITLIEGMKLIEDREIEPPISDSMDDYTQQVTDKIIQKIKERGTYL